MSSKGNSIFRQQLNEHVEFSNTKSCGLYFWALNYIVTLSKVRSEILHGLPPLISIGDLCVCVCVFAYTALVYSSWTKRHNNFKIPSKNEVLSSLKYAGERGTTSITLQIHVDPAFLCCSCITVRLPAWLLQVVFLKPDHFIWLPSELQFSLLYF